MSGSERMAGIPITITRARRAAVLLALLAVAPGLACSKNSSPSGSPQGTYHPTTTTSTPPSRALEVVYVDAATSTLQHYDDAIGAAETLATIPNGDFIVSCAAAYDAGNLLHVAYVLEETAPTSATFTVMVMDQSGGTWSLPRGIAQVYGGPSFQYVGIAADTHGAIHVVFDEATASASGIFHYDGATGTIEPIAQGASTTSPPSSVAVSAPSIAADAAGALHVAYIQTTTYFMNGQSGACTVELLSGTTGAWTLSTKAQQAIPPAAFSTAVGVTNSAQYVSTAIAVSAQGGAEVFFGERDYNGPLGSPVVQTAMDHYTDATTGLEQPVVTSVSTVGQIYLPGIAIDASGVMHIAFILGDISTPTQYSIYTDAGATGSWPQSTLRAVVPGAGGSLAYGVAD